MNKFLILLSAIFLISCTSISTDNSDQQNSFVTEVTPKDRRLERINCPKSVYPALEKRQACIIGVRRGLTAQNANIINR